MLRQDFAVFAARCFHELNPRTELGMNSFSEGWAQFTFYRLSSYFTVNTSYYAQQRRNITPQLKKLPKNRK